MKTLQKVVLVSFFYVLLVGPNTLTASEIVHQFSNPSFSGNGYSSHVLSIEQLQYNREKNVKDDAKSAAAAAVRAENNTTIAKFIKNVESRIYAQIAKQLVENMFSNGEAANFGVFSIEGNTVTYEKLTLEDGQEIIRLTIVSEDGTETILDIPVATGSF